jgi:osmoprotectant transport system ATP-binding protein
MPPVVVFQEVTKTYPGNIQAVDGVSFELEEGEFLCLIGPSGCGKTTILKMVNRLVEPSSGSVYVEGKEVMEWDPIKLRRHIGYVIQQIGLFPHLNVEENITYVLSIMGVPHPVRRRKARELLDVIGLEESYLRRFPRELSGGEKQRVGVARALASDPKIVLMDEPFGALDQISKEQLQNELLRLHRRLGKTILFVTHDLQEAIKLSTRIGIMKKGRILQVGTVQELLFSPADPFVEEFLGAKGFFHTLHLLTASEVLEESVPVVREGRVGSPEENFLSRHPDGRGFVLVVDEKKRFLGAKNESGEVLRCATVTPFTPLEEVLRAMFVSGQTWAAVVDPEGGKLLGVVDFHSICSRLKGYCGRENEKMPS